MRSTKPEDREGCTLEQVAGALGGITRERARQIQRDALTKVAEALIERLGRAGMQSLHASLREQECK